MRVILTQRQICSFVRRYHDLDIRRVNEMWELDPADEKGIAKARMDSRGIETTITNSALERIGEPFVYYFPKRLWGVEPVDLGIGYETEKPLDSRRRFSQWFPRVIATHIATPTAANCFSPSKDWVNRRGRRGAYENVVDGMYCEVPVQYFRAYRDAQNRWLILPNAEGEGDKFPKPESF